MEPLATVHLVTGYALVLLAFVVGAWGLAKARDLGAGSDPGRSKLFAHLLQLVHTLVAVEMLIGLLMYADGARSSDGLHAKVYGPFMLVAIIASYAYRTKDAAVNVRVFSVSSLIVFALGLRAITTGT